MPEPVCVLGLSEDPRPQQVLFISVEGITKPIAGRQNLNIETLNKTLTPPKPQSDRSKPTKPEPNPKSLTLQEVNAPALGGKKHHS